MKRHDKLLEVFSDISYGTGDPGLLRGIANRLGGDQAAFCGAICGGGGVDRLL